MTQLSSREFFRLVGLPSLIFVLVFFGGSELLEHHFYYRLSEATLHVLHTVRGVLSVILVCFLVYHSLSRAEESFAHQMETICSLLNVANQGLIAFDASWNVLSLNQGASEMLGNIHSGDFDKWVDRIRSELRTQTQVECLDPTEEKQLRVLALQSQEKGTLLLIQDVTGDHRKEEQWLITEKMATMGRMAAGLAHEIGTPLNIISGRAELIESMQAAVCAHCEAKPNCAVGKHISVIFQQIDRITRIIKQLLAQAREPARQKEMFAINDSVQKVIAFLQPELDKRKILFHLNLRKDLPPLYGSADQYQQVLINLLTNAMDAVEGKPGIITITTSCENGEIALSVSDNGMGIPEENMTKIFDPFFTTKEFGKGTGLGLTVTSNIVQAHGGRVDVKSKPDQGTVIQIHLPVGVSELEITP